MFLERKKKWVGQTGHTYPESCVLIYPFWTFYKQTFSHVHMCTRQGSGGDLGFCLECAALYLAIEKI